jgi:hypothetical protein
MSVYTSVPVCARQIHPVGPTVYAIEIIHFWGVCVHAPHTPLAGALLIARAPAGGEQESNPRGTNTQREGAVHGVRRHVAIRDAWREIGLVRSAGEPDITHSGIVAAEGQIPCPPETHRSVKPCPTSRRPRNRPAAQPEAAPEALIVVRQVVLPAIASKLHRLTAMAGCDRGNPASPDDRRDSSRTLLST